MSASPPSVQSGPGPTPPPQRLPWIDALRGIALLGILLMNVEIFNRAYGALANGLDPAATGIDRIADVLIYVFVRTKFWVLFSLLFGMGFALMLDRTHRSDRAFLRVYLRRTLVLLLFGALHGILIWEGDILTGYAIAALFLLLAMFGRLRDGLVVATVLALSVALFRYAPLALYLFMLLIAGVSGLYIRGDHRFRLFGRDWLLVPCLLAALGLLQLVGGPIAALLTGKTTQLTTYIVLGLESLLLAWLTWRRREPAVQRPLQIGLAWCLIPFIAFSLGSAALLYSPVPQTAQERERTTQALQKQQQEAVEEARILSSGTYAEAVKLRADRWWKEASGAGWSIFYFVVFLIGLWLVRSGIAVQPSQHPRLLRRLCVCGLTSGLALSVGSALFLPLTQVTGRNEQAYSLQISLHMLGAFPLALGYLSLVLLAWQTAAGKVFLSWLAPAGRMALTNYLMQSVVCSLVFYGYGLGHWGMQRGQQAAFCLALFAVQVVLSHLWLRHFRFGPMEWVWRRLTYGRA